jgi:hypothetical protein
VGDLARESAEAKTELAATAARLEGKLSGAAVTASNYRAEAARLKEELRELREQEAAASKAAAAARVEAKRLAMEMEAAKQVRSCPARIFWLDLGACPSRARQSWPRFTPASLSQSQYVSISYSRLLFQALHLHLNSISLAPTPREKSVFTLP